LLLLLLASCSGGKKRSSVDNPRPDETADAAAAEDAALADAPADEDAANAPTDRDAANAPADGPGAADASADRAADLRGGLDAMDAAVDRPLEPGDALPADAPPASDGGVWSAAIVQLTAEKALSFFVAPDERHLAYSTNRADPTAFGCLGRSGVGEIKLLITDPIPSVVVADKYGGFTDARFTDDARALVFTQYQSSFNPCADWVGLRYVLTNGSPGGSLDTADYYHDLGVSGATVKWRGFGAGATDPGTREVRKIGGGGSLLGSTGSVMQLDPTGNSVLYDTEGELRVAAVDGRRVVVVNDGSLGGTYPFEWSPDGTRVAFGYSANGAPTTLVTMAVDGSARRTLHSSCNCRGVVFSPDSRRVAFDVKEADGSLTFIVAPFVGGPPVTLTGVRQTDNESTPQVWFSVDGRWLEVLTWDGALFSAPTAASGSFARLNSPGTSVQDKKVEATIDQSFFAFVELDANKKGTLVVTTPDGRQQARRFTGIAEGAWYERTAGAPRLAVAASASGIRTLFLFPTDGSSGGTQLPILPWERGPATATWVGRVLVYPASTGVTTTVDLAAASEDGQQSEVIARDTSRFPQVGRPDATRIFFARKPESGGGIYMFAPPAESGPPWVTVGNDAGAPEPDAAVEADARVDSGIADARQPREAAIADAAPATPPCTGKLAVTPFRFIDKESGLSALALGDFTRDGHADMVVANQSSNTYTSLLNYGIKVTYYTPPGPSAIALADVSGDGTPDVIVASSPGNVRIARANGDGTFTNWDTLTTCSGARAVAAGDFDGDGDVDFTVACATANKLMTFMNAGGASFPQHFTNATEPGSDSVAVGDLDGDGLPDVATASPTAAMISVFLALGDGRLAERVSYPAGAGAHAIAIADFDGDGRNDIVVANAGDGTVGIFLNQGAGTFAAQATYPAGSTPAALAVADFDGDHRMDVVVGSSSNTGVSILLGAAGGKLAASVTFPFAYPVKAMASADLNNDQRPDFASVNGDDTIAAFTITCGP
jgi:hypothetical protein